MLPQAPVEILGEPAFHPGDDKREARPHCPPQFRKGIQSLNQILARLECTYSEKIGAGLESELRQNRREQRIGTRGVFVSDAEQDGMPLIRRNAEMLNHLALDELRIDDDLSRP